VDSPLRFEIESGFALCEWGLDKKQCKDPIIRRHCPKSCDKYTNFKSCENYACKDAPNKFTVVDFGPIDCLWVQLSAHNPCLDMIGVNETCQDTCDYCGLP